MYLSPSIMKILEPRLRALKPGTRIVSHQFAMPRLDARSSGSGRRIRIAVVGRSSDRRSDPNQRNRMALEFRKTVRADYPDVITDRRRARAGSAGALRCRAQAVMAARIERRAERARKRERIGFLDPERRHRRHVDHGQGRARGQFRRRRDSRTICSGNGSRAPVRRRGPGASVEVGLRNVAYALLSGADGWMFDGEDALGQVSTMSLDNQRNLKLAIHRDPRFLAVAEQVAGGDEQVGDGLLRQADRRRLAQAARLHDQDLSRARPAPRRSPRPQRRRIGLLGLDRRRHALHRQQPSPPDRFRRVDRAVSAEDPDRGRSGALERHPVVARAASRTRRPARSRPTCSSSRSKRATS